MSYSLDPAIPMSEAVRRVAFAELDLANAALSTTPDRHSGVHSARKCLKRLRSLLLLVRPGVPEPMIGNLSERLAAIARELAPARDANALLDAIDKLEPDEETFAAASPIRSLRRWLEKRREIAERNLASSAASEAMRGLRELKPALAGLAVHPDEFAPLAQGLRQCYRATRKSFRHAFVTGNDEDFHEWRKGVQHHWRQMQLLAPCSAAELPRRADAARALSQLLGDDHDIAMLRRLVSTPTMVFGNTDDTTAFLKRCRKRHKALRQEAKTRASQLFAERSRPFAERVESAWLHAAPRAPEAMADRRPDNVVPFSDLKAGRVS
jgi:CHAD domain-containing protein